MPSLRTILLIAGLVVVLATVGTIGILKRQVIAAKWQAAFSQDDAEARKQEGVAQATVTSHTETIIVRDRAVEAAYREALKAVMEAPDADHPLDPDRARRIRAHDDGLCKQAPGLAGCAPADNLPDQGRD